MSYVLDPFLFFFVLTIVFTISVWRCGDRRRPRWFLAISVAGLTFVCMPAVSYLALGSLEWWYPPRADIPADTQATVVLSGCLRPVDPEWNQVELGEDTLYRTLLALEIYRQRESCPILVTGGKANAARPGLTLAEAMAEFLMENGGVREESLIIENQSRSTYENARESARLLRERGIDKVALVTDATHLWRAESCFLAQGIQVVPCGVSYRTVDVSWSVTSFLPSSTAAKRNRQVFHEWLGLLWYRLKGRI